MIPSTKWAMYCGVDLGCRCSSAFKPTYILGNYPPSSVIPITAASAPPGCVSNNASNSAGATCVQTKL